MGLTIQRATTIMSHVTYWNTVHKKKKAVSAYNSRADVP